MTKSLIKTHSEKLKIQKQDSSQLWRLLPSEWDFAGIKATVPSMYNLARTYTDEQELMDYRLVSTVGFDEDDIKAAKIQTE